MKLGCLASALTSGPSKPQHWLDACHLGKRSPDSSLSPQRTSTAGSRGTGERAGLGSSGHDRGGADRLPPRRSGCSPTLSRTPGLDDGALRQVAFQSRLSPVSLDEVHLIAGRRSSLINALSRSRAPAVRPVGAPVGAPVEFSCGKSFDRAPPGAVLSFQISASVSDAAEERVHWH